MAPINAILQANVNSMKTPMKRGCSMKRTGPFVILNLFLVLLAALMVIGCGSDPLYSTSGQVSSGGSALSGVTMTITGPEGRTAITDSSGNYSFGDLPVGTYIVTPSSADYTFVPSARVVYLYGMDATSFNFSAVVNGRLATATHTVSVKSDNTLWVWGNNSSGQLGDGTTTNRTSRFQVATLSGMKTVDTGEDHTAALKSDGTVWTWGNNSNGQLGNGTTTNSSFPIKVALLSDVIDITAGHKFTVALKSDGTVWAWGINSSGQLGNGTTSDSSIPVQVTGLTTAATAVSAGYDHVLSLQGDTSVWAWGSNSNGQLGNGTTTDSPVPVQVTGLSSAIAIAAGNDFSLALKNIDFTIRAWGINTLGQLGNGAIADSSTAVAVSGMASVTAIAAGYDHAVALKNDGTVWTWGDNSNGQLGNGTTIGSTTSVQATDMSGGIAIAAGRDNSAAMKNDRTLWGWGSNNSGQIGDGTTTDRWTPVQTP
jgi:alpha-tubulin suppressor-like RCC1 family protein